MQKKCFKCGEVKDLSCFYKHPRMADGRVNKCKECNRADVRENRKKKIDYYREYDKKRPSRKTNAQKIAYKIAYPSKYKARVSLGNAVRDGKIKKPTKCDICEESHYWIHGHHDDYSFPLNVRWLCPPCHFSWHKENGEGLNGF